MPELTTQGPVSAAGGSSSTAVPAGTTTVEDPAKATGPATDDKGDATGPATKSPGKTADTGSERFLTLDDIEDEAVRKAVEGILGQREKQMMANYTKKTQEISTRKQDLEIIDSFRADPQGTLNRVAQQYGLQVVDPRNGNRQAQNAGPGGNQAGPSASVPWDNPDWAPQTWGELANSLMGGLTERVAQQLMTQLAPVIRPLVENVEKITSTHIEQELDGIDGNWRMYEDEIKTNMKEHPTLIKSPNGLRKLYMLSVPEDVYTSHAVQAALKKVEEKAGSARIGSRSQTRQNTAVTARGGTFADAVAAAKDQLAKQGR